MNLPVSTDAADARASRGDGAGGGAVQRGFTLIEFLAIVGIIAFLASVVLVNVIQRMKRSAQDAETLSMEAIAGALRTNIIRTKRIPTVANWPQAVAEELSLPLSRVTQTRVGNARVFLADDAWPAALTLPYTNAVTGTALPANARLLVASSVGSAIGNPSFASGWTAPDQTVPAGWTFAGDVNDLKIQRVDLRTIFHRIVMSNLDPFRLAPYTIDVPENTNAIAFGGVVNGFFLRESAVSLHYASGALQAREYLRDDTSYVFEDGRWNRHILYGAKPLLGPFGELAEQFRTNSINPNTKNLATPQAVIEEVFSYLYIYGQWGTTPPQFGYDPGGLFPGINSWQQLPLTLQVRDAQARLEIISANLIVP
jgi:type II secretory pathway pseudopilin PulG